MDQSDGPVALVTGASSGIGYAMAAHWVAAGWRVYGMSRSGKVAAGVRPLVADVTDPRSVRQAIEELWAEAGQLQAVVHSAGIGGAAPVEYFPIEKARHVIETNLVGSLNVLQACLPHLRQQGSGTLVVVSSIAGLMGVPYHGIYSASKAAVEALVESVRLELMGSGVNVVSVCPGDTATPIIGHQFRATAEEVPDFYQRNYERAERAMRESVDQGYPPEKVAEAIARICAQPNPKVRYMVGPFIQTIAPAVKRFLPSRFFEWALGKYYGQQ
ncbi:MAG: SDR family oxidoreductase [Lewinella sp.]|nr:SDR family oxidoreductase [Lewinella sp.]